MPASASPSISASRWANSWKRTWSPSSSARTFTRSRSPRPPTSPGTARRRPGRSACPPLHQLAQARQRQALQLGVHEGRAVVRGRGGWPVDRIASRRRARRGAQGVGIAFAYWSDRWLRPLIEAGEVVTLLEAYSPPFPGWHLYYPRHSTRVPAVRVLVDFLRAADRARTGSLPRSPQRPPTPA